MSTNSIGVERMPTVSQIVLVGAAGGRDPPGRVVDEAVALVVAVHIAVGVGVVEPLDAVPEAVVGVVGDEGVVGLAVHLDEPPEGVVLVLVRVAVVGELPGRVVGERVVVGAVVVDVARGQLVGGVAICGSSRGRR